MKNTILTIASIATLAGAAHAQTVEFVNQPETYSGVSNFIAGTGSANPFDGVGVTWGAVAYDNETYYGVSGSTYRAYDAVNFWNASGSGSTAGTIVGSGTLTTAWSTFGVDSGTFWAIDGANNVLKSFANEADFLADTNALSTDTFGQNGAGVTWTHMAVADGKFYGMNTAGTFRGYDDVDFFLHSGSGSTTGTIIASGTASDVGAFGASAVPEPSSTALLGLGGLALLLRRKK